MPKLSKLKIHNRVIQLFCSKYRFKVLSEVYPPASRRMDLVLFKRIRLFSLCRSFYNEWSASLKHTSFYTCKVNSSSLLSKLFSHRLRCFVPNDKSFGCSFSRL